MSRSILFLAHRIPYPPDKGDKIRTFHWLERLAGRHRVRLACFVDDPADMRHVPALSAMCADVVAIPLDRATKLRRAAGALMGGGSRRSITAGVYDDADMWQALEERRAAAAFDAVFAFSSAVAPYALAIPARRRVIDLCDCDSRKWLDYAERSGWPMSAVYRREARLLGALEQACLKRFDAVCVVNQREAQALVAAVSLNRTATVRERRETLGRGSEYPFNNDLPESLRARVAGLNTARLSRGWRQTGGTPVPPNIAESGPREGLTVPPLRKSSAGFTTMSPSWARTPMLHVIPNGVDVPADTPLPNEPRVGFFGALDYRPNVDGLKWFVREVWPRVRRGCPEAEFHIVGRAPVRAVRRLSWAAGVRLVGPVDDLSPHYRGLRACVAPLHIARGVQNKVLEAMAHGRPIVATSCVAEGLDATAGEQLLIADDAATFAAVVLRLLDVRSTAAQDLAVAARTWVRCAHQWTTACDAMERLICGEEQRMPSAEMARAIRRLTALTREGLPA